MNADLRTLLLSGDGVSAAAPGGITWQHAPQGVVGAYVVLTQVAGDVGMDHAGRHTTDSKRVQIDCYAATLAGAETLREAITNSLAGYVGDVGSTRFLSCLPNTPRDFYESALGLHRCLADFTIIFSPSA